MKQILNTLCVAFLFITFISCSKSDDPATDPNVTFLATLNGGNKVPANGSTATGNATLTFISTSKILTITVTHNVGTPTAGHIHKAAAGTNGSVIFGFSSPASPINYTSVALDAAKEADLNANLYYVNVHTAANPGGKSGDN